MQVLFCRNPLKQIAIDPAYAVGGRTGRMEIAASPGELPQFACNPVHIDRQADSAVAYQRDPQFLVPHRPMLCTDKRRKAIAFIKCSV